VQRTSDIRREKTENRSWLSCARHVAAAFQATPHKLSLPHLRSIGGKYTGSALTNFAPTVAFSVLTPALVYFR
jgi:hypothetical protein